MPRKKPKPGDDNPFDHLHAMGFSDREKDAAMKFSEKVSRLAEVEDISVREEIAAAYLTLWVHRDNIRESMRTGEFSDILGGLQI